MKNSLSLILIFFSLLFSQVFVFNQILFLGAINPYLYIIFVFLYPLKVNRLPFLLYSFLLGLGIDFFSDTGGIYAFSILFIAYIRLFFIKLYFRKNKTDYSFFKLKSEPFGKTFNYVVTLTVIHHLIYFSFANFSFENYNTVITNTLFSSIFTLLLYFSGSYIFNKTE